ncbi:MAG TPA: CDP-diacylglycerol--glycerol-3-phosphate 3-phosphatidyltransferase [Bryobacteraceae bacterium]|jgi:CDP-diacylglycerol--glycerol-3-phosphate 3-phosphatidyltransferase|nr:CDP-diacylglycerol--glycerol-3-phosphate 3-phosphatidyltransferase [Bryobacteraceae bacterium]
MNVPNSLTIARIFFVPLLVAVLVQGRIAFHYHGNTIDNTLIALLIFWVAAATDLLDGYLARRWKQETTIGTLLDPIADKLLVSAALIALVQENVVPAWLVILLVGREFAVSGLRSIAASEGFTIKASELGKTKTVSQMVAISLLLISVRRPAVSTLADISLYVVVLFSTWSAVAYFVKFWRMLDTSIKQRRRAELLTADRQRRRALFAEKRAAMMARRQARLEKKRTDFATQTADLPPS